MSSELIVDFDPCTLSVKGVNVDFDPVVCNFLSPYQDEKKVSQV